MKTNEGAVSRRAFICRGAVLGIVGVGWGTNLLRGAGLGGSGGMVVAVVGLGRGQDLMQAAISLPGVELAYVCDVDDVRIASARKVLEAKGRGEVRAVKDFRRILDDRRVDAIFIATCNHWHAPATILACQAGKHVYVEKPGSHNPHEAELMVASARKHGRVVQLGTQRRSFPGIREGIERLHQGVIGRVSFARCWYTNNRPSIGRGRRVPIPDTLDYSIWQGPAPEHPYVDNLVHYNWHWRWHWGNGELGNNGVHYLDLVRWGLRVDYPRTISYTGGRYQYVDDQETPDTGVVTYDFGGTGASWEHSSCHPRKPETFPLVNFYGTEGVLSLDGNGYKVYDLGGKLVSETGGPGGDAVHVADFLEAIRSGARPNADIAEGQKSALLCHLGNIAYRVGRAIHLDQGTGRIIDDREASRLWRRAYRKGWEPRV